MKRFLFLALTVLGFLTLQGCKKSEKLIYHHKLGKTEVVLLSDGQNTGDPSALIGASEEILNEFVPTGTLNSAFNIFLLKIDGKKIIVDAGMGFHLVDNLASEGLQPEDIDMILLTHMHGDHIGGLLKDGQKVFPNAKLYISEKEVAYWTDKEYMSSLPEGQQRGFIGAQQVVETYKDNLVLFEPQEIENMQDLIPGVKSIASYGHTPGHTCYMVENGGDKLFIWGDMINIAAVQVPHPEIPTRFDVDPDMAAATRAHILNYLETNKLNVAGMHVEYPGIGKLVRSNRGLELKLD